MSDTPAPVPPPPDKPAGSGTFLNKKMGEGSGLRLLGSILLVGLLAAIARQGISALKNGPGTDRQAQPTLTEKQLQDLKQALDKQWDRTFKQMDEDMKKNLLYDNPPTTKPAEKPETNSKAKPQ